MGWKGQIVGFIVGFAVFTLVAVDGPLPIGDAAAMLVLAAIYTRHPGSSVARRMGSNIEESYHLEHSPPVIKQMSYFDPVCYYV